MRIEKIDFCDCDQICVLNLLYLYSSIYEVIEFKNQLITINVY